MAASVYSKRSSGLRSNKSKTKEKLIAITSARYIRDFAIALKFTTGEEKIVDFLPLFHKYVKGKSLRHLSINNFKRFIVKNGNIYWGTNEDVIFSMDLLHREALSQEDEEVLYII